MILDQLDTLDEMLIKVAQRFKRIRKIKKYTQEELSLKSNVSYGSIKRFENTGEISLYSLARLCDALDMRDEISNMFKNTHYNDIKEVLNDK